MRDTHDPDYPEFYLPKPGHPHLHYKDGIRSHRQQPLFEDTPRMNTPFSTEGEPNSIR